MSTLRFRAAACVCAVVLAIPARAVTYTALLLHPTGFEYSVAQGISGTKQVGVGYDDTTDFATHALLWSGSAASKVDLHPAGFDLSDAVAVSGTAQVGYGNPTGSDSPHALLWSGTAASKVDLHPTSGFDESQARGVSGTTQVGYGLGSATGDNYHALMWSGSAASKVDLHPTTGFTQSYAVGVSGSTQVGYGETTAGPLHALLWTGTAGSKVDLHPATGFDSSQATAVSGSTQVGFGNPTGSEDPHALSWSGTAASMVDLNPAGFTSSRALGVAGPLQVGSGRGASTGDSGHALLWNGTAASVVDLHPFLSGLGPNFVDSAAMGVIENGWVVGSAFDDTFTSYAVLWKPVTDFNQNGVTDAADYVRWRKGLGTTYTQLDYYLWRVNFGNSASGSGAGADFLSSRNVPEPSHLAILILVAILWQYAIRRAVDNRRSPLLPGEENLVDCIQAQRAGSQ
jgi:hypothetical protein